MSILSFLKKDKPKKRLAIVDVKDSDFKQQVLQRSHKTTVIVDFWAAWCGPCRQLGPVLERIAEEPDSDFILAKLDTEHNRRTAARYNIRSIPAVKAFKNGIVVNEFNGALPSALVRRFIKKVSEAEPPQAQIKGSTDPVQRLGQVKQHLRKGRAFEAYVLLNDFPTSPQSAAANQLLPMARFMFDIDIGDGLTGLEELDLAYSAAVAATKKRKPEEALEQLFVALEIGEDIDRPFTSDVIDSYLTLLGDGSKIADKYRQKLTINSTPTGRQ